MKSRFTKIAAAAMALTMCMPTAAFAASTTPPAANGPKEGSFTTSFDVYSPALTVSVPVNLNVQINPIADSSADTVKKFTVASNSIDILNASVDVDADTAIPVVATIKASIESGEDVITKYNTFTADDISTAKKIHLELSAAGTVATVGVKDGGTAAFDTEKKLDLSQYAVNAEAEYTTPAKSTAVTKFGSLLSMDIAGPSTSDSTGGATFSTDATKVTPTVGSFAVTGVANANADWNKDDVKVNVTYNVKASKALSITTPSVAAVTATAGSDATITVPDVGEATVLALGVHNDDNAYGDFLWETGKFEAVSAPNATTASQTDITITIDKDDEALKYLASDFAGKAQDLVIALSDGRYIVSTMTVNAATSTP